MATALVAYGDAILAKEDAVTPDAAPAPQIGTAQHADTRDSYAWFALVSPAGMIEELSDQAGVSALREAPMLVHYARALIESGRSAAQFWWQSAQATGWLNVTMTTVGGETGQAEVLLVPADPPYRLTSRELDVLTLIAGGLSNQEIADRLFASPKTVSTHVEHVLHKLGTPTRAGAAAIAAEQGIVRLPVPGGGSGLKSLTVGLLDQPPTTAASARPRSGAGLVRQKRPFLLGSVIPLHGPAASDGLEMRDGAALAIAEINEQGGIAGRPIRHIVADTDIFTAHGIESAFQQLAAADVDAITSGYMFAEEAAREGASAYGAPYLHATTSELQVARVRDDPARYGRIFHVCPSEIHYGSGFIRFLDSLTESGRWRAPSRRLLFIECAVPSGQMANDATITTAEQSGWLIDHVEVLPAVGANWREVVQVIHRRDPAAIMITQFLPTELANFQRSFVADPTDSLIYAVYSPSIPQFLDTAGRAAEGLLWSTVSGTYGDHIGMSFAKRYQAAYGRPPGRSHAGIAYDEVHLLAQAWARAGNPRSFAAVADQLRRAAHRGVNGTYVFGHAGQCGLAYPDVTPDPSVGQAHLILQIQQGRHRILAPAPYVASQFVRPAWLSRAA